MKHIIAEFIEDAEVFLIHPCEPREQNERWIIKSHALCEFDVIYEDDEIMTVKDDDAIIVGIPKSKVKIITPPSRLAAAQRSQIASAAEPVAT